MILQQNLMSSQNTLTLKAAQDLFNEIVNDPGSESLELNNVCLISGKYLNTNTVTLPCGHKFDYLSLLSDQVTSKRNYYGKPNACPYCRQSYIGTMPYRADLSTVKVRNVNTPVDECYEKSHCYFEKSGQHCTVNATIPVGDKFACWRHYKRALKLYGSDAIPKQEVATCKALLKSGKSKGKICGAKIKDKNNEFCKRHNKP